MGRADKGERRVDRLRATLSEMMKEAVLDVHQRVLNICGSCFECLSASMHYFGAKDPPSQGFHFGGGDVNGKVDERSGQGTQARRRHASETERRRRFRGEKRRRYAPQKAVLSHR